MHGLGVDSVDIAHFRKVIRRTPRLVERLFTPAEVAFATRYPDPAEHLAVRFAAKEATMKALGVGIGGFPLTDVEVQRRASGMVSLFLTGRARELAKLKGVEGWLLTMSHTRTVGTAVVVAL